MRIIEPEARLNQLTEAVIGAAIEVHRHLGPGYLESYYGEALARELELQGIEFERQCCFGIDYKGTKIGQGKVDFLVEGRLVVELKAVDALHPIHKAQVISYLRATHLTLGLLINFNSLGLKDGIRRVVLTDED